MQQRLTRPSAASFPKQLISSIVIVALVIFGSAAASLAGDSATTVVRFGVEEISAMEIQGPLSGPIVLTSPPHGTAQIAGSDYSFIRYTSVVPELKTRSISAAIASGSLPRGCTLKLNVAGVSGNGEIGRGVPEGVRLSGTPQSIMTGIGNCCTGTSPIDGARLEYTLEVNDAAELVPGETTVVVVRFTID